MTGNNGDAIIQKNNNPAVSAASHLSIVQTCLSGVIMGFIAYTGSFASMPVIFTVAALVFGTESLMTVIATAISQLLAGYLHTHASRAGISASTKLFGGFYIAKVEMRNRRQCDETRWQALRRFFLTEPLNALILNLMWESFTIAYLIQSELLARYVSNSSASDQVLIYGSTRYVAGCASAIATAIINQLWQRHLARRRTPHAIFNTDRDKLKLNWRERAKLLSLGNMENWIKISVMVPGALFTLASRAPNATGLHLLDERTKKLITDLLVIHGGWLFVRDALMLLLKKSNKAPSHPSKSTIEIMIDEQKKLLKNENPFTASA